MKIFVSAVLILAVYVPAFSAENDVMEEILREVIDQVVYEARRTVRESTGIDERRWERDGKLRELPPRESEEALRRLRHLDREHRHVMLKIEEELNRELRKAGEEFSKESHREEKIEKVVEKRRRLEEKVDKAYRKFEEKAAEIERKYADKRRDIFVKR